jgi:hypothetical protein
VLDVAIPMSELHMDFLTSLQFPVRNARVLYKLFALFVELYEIILKWRSTAIELPFEVGGSNNMCQLSRP